MNHKSGITNYQSHRLIKVYYKSRQSYYKLRQLCLLQITTNCCYKFSLRRLFLLQITTKFLQITTAITNNDTTAEIFYGELWLSKEQRELL